MSEKLYLADSMAFLAFPGQPVIADQALRLDLAHVTAAPPLHKGAQIPNCETIASIVSCRGEILRQPALQLVTVADHVPLDAGHKCGVVMGLQNAPESHLYLRGLFSAGIRVFQLWYANVNSYGGGFAYPRTRLTIEGKEALKHLAKIGGILDLSHAGHATARDCLKYIAANGLPLRVMASHTGCYRIFPHIRNLPDDVLEDIAELNGIVGIYTLSFGLHQSDDSLETFLDHLEHAAEVCGGSHVAVGSDGTYRTATKATLCEQFKKMRDMLDPDGIFNARCPDHCLETYTPVRMEIIRGWIAERFKSESLVEQVTGANLRNFFISALPH